MEINGLPLHPLSVHAAVVLAPLVALLALGSLVPAWRDRLRWPLAAGAVVAIGAVLVAFVSGNSFRDANAFFSTPPSEITRQIDHHHSLALALLWVTIGFGALALLSAVLHPKEGPLRWLLAVPLAGGAVAVVVLVVLTGDAGARAVWDGFQG